MLEELGRRGKGSVTQLLRRISDRWIARDLPREKDLQGQGRLGPDVLQGQPPPGHHGEDLDPGPVREAQPGVEPGGDSPAFLHLPRGPYRDRAILPMTIRKAEKGSFEHTRNVRE